MSLIYTDTMSLRKGNDKMWDKIGSETSQMLHKFGQNTVQQTYHCNTGDGVITRIKYSIHTLVD